jgi:arylsulfatase A
LAVLGEGKQVFASHLPGALRTLAVSLTGILWAALTAQGAQNKPAGQPNIVVILAEDIGLGDIHCYAPQYAKVATPHVDRLAAEGMFFTDAHASALICTPSRF